MAFVVFAAGFFGAVVIGAIVDRLLGRGHLGERRSTGSHLSESEATYRHMY